MSKLYRRFGPRSEIFLLGKAVQKVSQGFFTSKFRGEFGFETVAVQPDSKRFGPPLNFPRPFAQTPSAFNCNKKIARKDVGTMSIAKGYSRASQSFLFAHLAVSGA